MKTWHCVVFSVFVHGLIFSIPVMSRTHPDLRPETVQWLITSLPSPEISPETSMEHADTVVPPPSLSLPDRTSKPATPAVRSHREPTVSRKKPAAKPKPADPASPFPSSSDSISTQSPEKTEAASASPAVVQQTRSDDQTSLEENAISSRDSHGAAASEQTTGGGHSERSENIAPVSVGALGGPQFIQRSAPRYPRPAQRKGLEGTVMLRLKLDASGQLIGVEVIGGAGNGFDEEAVEAVKRSSFSPAIRDGRAVACLAMLKIRYQLTGD